MKLRGAILLFLLIFGLTPLVMAVAINLPLVLDRVALFYQKAYLQNLRADFRDLDQHLASRHEMIRLLAKLPEPGLILGEQGNEAEIDQARARYTGWINQILGEQRDIVQILFLDHQGQERFWLERDAKTQEWNPTAQLPDRPSEELLSAGLRLPPGEILVSRIRIAPDAGTQDPRQFMRLSLVSAITPDPKAPADGLVVLNIDVGGMAQFYRETFWVTDQGRYLRPGQPWRDEALAFADFPGLERIFAQELPGLWRGERGAQVFWVPMFVTEDTRPLWVGRAVDPSPLDSFRNALVLRVAGVILVLILAVMITAGWIARRLERMGRELTAGVDRVVRTGEEVRFAWQGPQEVQAFGAKLSALAHNHAEYLRGARAHTEELERSNRYKSQFLANVSHELRTPLNSILLLSKMLAEDKAALSPQQRRQAQIIHAAGRDLRTLIDNILDISRIEAGKVSLNREWLEPREMVVEVLELVGPQFADKGLYLRLEVAPDSPTRIHSDREKLRQILKNFLANAVKFTDVGGATVAIGRDDNGNLTLSVADTGIGIPTDKHALIFEAFQQVDGSTRRRFGGTGLGLSISRELAQRLGGGIQIESQEGQGARFTLWLPVDADTGDREDVKTLAPARLREPRAAETQTLTRRDYDGRWVLLVERDAASLVAETRLLADFGLRVEMAADADEARDTLAEERGCALILLAEMVSLANTCDTIMAIRAWAPAAGLPLVVIGRSGELEARNRYLAAGADDLIAKPITSARLEEVLVAMLGQAAPGNPQETA
ncbi:MAG: response regulator [Gammaproteobacteria bacterium]|nr:ATP-binding protein [Candidatus Thioaporhodococcus sediminis]TNF52390.1 MAG: response regulator [Gammaproteobacteria bacterium]